MKPPLKMKIFLPPAQGKTPPPHPPALKIKIVQLKHKQPIYTESAVNKLQVFWPPLTNFRIYSDLSVLSISM